MKKHKPATLTKLKWWGVDFDQTICISRPTKDGKDWIIESPTEGVREFLYWVKSLGKKIVIHTARGSEDYIVIEQWMKENDLPFDMIWPGKLLADVYIDDKAVHYDGDWKKVKRQLKKIGKA